MNSYKLSTIFLVLAITIGCSNKATTPHFQAGPTETNFTITPSETVTPSTMLESDFPNGCINLTETPFHRDAVNGLIVAFDFDLLDYKSYFLDLKSNQLLDIEMQTPVPWDTRITNVSTTKVSPNNKFIQAYLTGKDYNIFRTIDEIIKTDDAKGQQDWNRGKWLDNERMLFQYWQVPNGNKIVVYSPFTGEKKEIQLELPNPYIVIDGGGKAAWVKADIDPSLKRVLYNDKGERLVLWDLDSQQELTSLPSPTNLLEGTWSPNGNEFAVPFPSSNSAPTEMLMINMDGVVTKLTNFNQKFPFSRVDANPSWSPDGRNIAYWLQLSNVANAEPKKLRQWLTITDTLTLDTKIYCLSPNIPPTHGGGIVWSPDSQQLIVNTNVLSEEMKPMLVDLNLLTQSEIDTHGLSVTDWMIAP